MGKSTPKPPPAPDPTKMAAAQTGSNINTASASAALNAVNQQSHLGSVNYDQTGSVNIGGNEVPRYTQTTTLSPQEQGLYDRQNAVSQQAYDTAGQAMGQAQNTLSSPFSLQNLPPLQTSVGQPQPISSYETVAPDTGFQRGVENTSINGQIANVGKQNSNAPRPGAMWGAAQPTGQQTGLGSAGAIQQGIGANDFSADRLRVEEAMMGRFDQDIARREQSTISRLNAQGLQQGTEAYGTEMDTLNRARNDARQQAVLAGGQEQSRLFGLEQAQGQFANSAQGQQYGQNLGAGQFTNEALGNLFGQNLSSVGQQNQQQGQLYGQNLQGAEFGNRAQAESFNQAESRQQAAAQASALQFQQNLAAGNFANQATGLYNQAAGQATGQNQAQAAFGNTAAQQGFDNSLSAASFANQGRQQSISEQQLQRSQPINEVAALLGLGPGVQAPNGAPNFGINVGGTDVLGAYGMQQAAQQNQYNQRMQQQNAMWGALGNLGGMAGAAFIGR